MTPAISEAPKEKEAPAAPKAETKAPAKGPKQPVEAIWIGGREDNIKRWELTLALFAKDHPDIKINTTMGSPNEKLAAAVAGGKPPDVGWFGVGIQPFAGLFRDAAAVMRGHGLNLDDYSPRLRQALTWRGKLLAIPEGLNTSSLFYNIEVFDKAGEKYPTDNMTWDDAIKTAQNITNRLKQADKPTVWGISTHAYIPTWMPFLYGGMLDEKGEKVITDRDIGIYMLKLVREAWDKHGAAPKPDALDQGGFAIKPFQSQQLAMVLFGTWGIAPAREAKDLKFDCVEFPIAQVGNKKARGAFGGVEEFFIMESSTNPDAEVFAVWIAKPTYQRWLGENGYVIPALKSVQDTFKPPASDPRPKNQLSFARAAEYITPIWPHPEYGKLVAAMGKHLNPYYNEGKVTPEEAIDNALKEMQQIVTDWNKLNL